MFGALPRQRHSLTHTDTDIPSIPTFVQGQHLSHFPSTHFSLSGSFCVGDVVRSSIRSRGAEATHPTHLTETSRKAISTIQSTRRVGDSAEHARTADQ